MYGLEPDVLALCLTCAFTVTLHPFGCQGDPGVGPHGGEDLLLDNGVGRVRASRNRCRGDGSDVGGSVGDDWGRQMALDS